MSIFRIQYPIKAFDGGLNNKYEPTAIADNESADCLNVVFDDVGAVQTRYGTLKFNTTAVGSYAGDGLFTTRYDSGNQSMVGWWNGTMYALGGTSTFTTVGSAQSIWTAGTRVDMAMYQDIAFFGNGNTPYKYNGTEFTRHGVPAPNSGPSVSSGTAGANGAATGDVNYKVAYVNSYAAIGDVGAATTTLTLASTATVSLVSLPLAPTSFGVGSRRLYRRDSTTGNAYKLVATIADNTTTSYVDSIAAASLGANAPTDNGVPPNWKYIIAHKERLWMLTGVDSFLWYSELGEPFTVASTNFLKMGDGDGEFANGLAVQGDSILVYKSGGSVWANYMEDTTPGNWRQLKTNAKYGLVSKHSIVDFGQGYQMYLGQRDGVLSGFHAMAGLAQLPDSTELTVAVVQSESKSDKIEPDIFSITQSAADKACGINFKNKLWFAVPYSSSTNNRVYQFDYTRRNKSEMQGSWVPFTGISAAAFTIYSGRLYYQDAAATGFVYQLESGAYSDNGAAINSYFWTKEFEGHEGHEDLHKDFRYGIFVVETLGDWNMNLTFRTDSDRGSGTTKTINLNPGGSLWGSMIWGVDLWGGGVLRSTKTVYFDTSSGRKIQFKFDNQNTAGRAFKVLRGSIYYNLRGQRHGNSY